MAEPPRGRVDLLLDPDDHVEITRGLLARNDPGRGLLVVHPTVGTRCLAYDLITAMGGPTGSIADDRLGVAVRAGDAAVVWALTDRVTHIVVLRAHLLDAGLWSELKRLVAAIGADLLLVHHGAPPSERWWAEVDDLKPRIFRRLPEAVAAYAADRAPRHPPAGTPRCHDPRLPDDLPTSPFLHWRADLFRDHPDDFARVDTTYGQGLDLACSWLADRTALLESPRWAEQLQAWLTRHLADSPAAGHAIAWLRGVQAGFLLHGWWLHLPVPGSLGGPGLTSVPVTHETANRIRAGTANPVLAAGVALSLITGLGPRALAGLTVEGLSRSADLVRLDFRMPDPLRPNVVRRGLTEYRTDTLPERAGTAVFHVPLPVRPLLQAAHHFLLRDGHILRCQQRNARHRLFEGIVGLGAAIRSAAGRGGITLPRGVDVVGLWQIRMQLWRLSSSLHDGDLAGSGRRGLSCGTAQPPAQGPAGWQSVCRDREDRLGTRWTCWGPDPRVVSTLLLAHLNATHPTRAPRRGGIVLERGRARELIAYHLAVRHPTPEADGYLMRIQAHPDALFAVRLTDRPGPPEPQGEEHFDHHRVFIPPPPPCGWPEDEPIGPRRCRVWNLERRKAVRRLPDGVAPFPQETRASYERRLVHANDMTIAQLRRRTALKYAQGDLPQIYSSLTGRPPQTFVYAMPEVAAASATLVPPGVAAGRLPLEWHVRSGACRHCVAASGATGWVEVFRADDRSVCVRHQVWIGTDHRYTEQVDIARLPEILAAYRRHRNLCRRYGRPAVATAFRDAATITRSWIGGRCYTSAAVRRLETVTKLQLASVGPREPFTDLLTYPESVGLASMLLSPFWHQQAMAMVREWMDLRTPPIEAEVRLRTGIPEFTFYRRSDPLWRYWDKRRIEALYRARHMGLAHRERHGPAERIAGVPVDDPLTGHPLNAHRPLQADLEDHFLIPGVSVLINTPGRTGPARS